MSNEAASPVPGPVETIEKGPRQRSFVALALALVGSIMAIIGFYVTITSALSGTGTDPGVTIGQVVFFVGIAFDLIAIVLSIIGLLSRGKKLFFVLAIVEALVPIVVFGLLANNARG